MVRYRSRWDFLHMRLGKRVMGAKQSTQVLNTLPCRLFLLAPPQQLSYPSV